MLCDVSESGELRDSEHSPMNPSTFTTITNSPDQPRPYRPDHSMKGKRKLDTDPDGNIKLKCIKLGVKYDEMLENETKKEKK